MHCFHRLLLFGLLGLLVSALLLPAFFFDLFFHYFLKIQ